MGVTSLFIDKKVNFLIWEATWDYCVVEGTTARLMCKKKKKTMNIFAFTKVSGYYVNS